MTLSRAAIRNKNYGVRAFFWGLLLAACVIVPVMIYDNGYFLYYGDFNVQEIPFYRLAHDTILSGDIGWSHLTDLGSNFIGSYSFYLLGSPFFYLTLLLPSELVAYAFGPLLILKLGCCSLTAYIYLRRYVRDPRYAVIGGLLYAFSGFSVYNLFYFHFHEAMIVFPLLLAALDEFHVTKRRGVVALALTFAAVINYYFFFGQALFLLIYYIVKLISRSYRFRVKEFFLLSAEAVIGVMLAMFLLLPSVAAITGNYRTSQLISGWNAVVYPASQRYIQILCAMFFPGDLPARANFTPSAGGKWSSVAVYLPMFSMTFVIAFFRKYKKSFLNILLGILLIMAFVPGLNSMFQALNSAYYARWYYMLTLVMILMTVYSLDHIRECDFKKGFIPTAIITGIISVVIGLMPYEAFKNSTKTVYKIGIEATPRRYWAFVAMTVVGLAATFGLYILFKKNSKYFIRILSLALSFFIIGYSSVYLWAAKRVSDHDDEFLQKYALNYGADITLDDMKEVRSDFYRTYDNMGMFWQTPSIQAFHSVVPGALMEFYNQSGVKRDVGSRPETKLYGFRALLSVKYLFAQEGLAKKDKPNLPYFEYLRNENGFDIYENTLYLPMGFTYDRFICQEEYLDLSDDVKHLALLKAMVLTQEQMKKYADITGYQDGQYLNLNLQFDEIHPQNTRHPTYVGYKSAAAEFEYTKEAYQEDVQKLQQNVCSRFAYVKGGFDAEFDNKGGDNLLFFSVPFDEGWTAYVNGEEAEIEVVNIGLTAVKVDGHKKSVIEFRYTTPMLKEGIIISLIGAGLFAIYLIANKGFSAKSRFKKRYRIKNRSKISKEGTV